jgi:hypothetical protein
MALLGFCIADIIGLEGKIRPPNPNKITTKKECVCCFVVRISFIGE